MATKTNLKTFSFNSQFIQNEGFKHSIFIGKSICNIINANTNITKLLLHTTSKGIVLDKNSIFVNNTNDPNIRHIFQNFTMLTKPKFLVELEVNEYNITNINCFSIEKIDIFSRVIDTKYKYTISKNEIDSYSPISIINNTVLSKSNYKSEDEFEKQQILTILYDFFH